MEWSIRFIDDRGELQGDRGTEHVTMDTLDRVHATVGGDSVLRGTSHLA